MPRGLHVLDKLKKARVEHRFCQRDEPDGGLGLDLLRAMLLPEKQSPDAIDLLDVVNIELRNLGLSLAPLLRLRIGFKTRCGYFDAHGTKCWGSKIWASSASMKGRPCVWIRRAVGISLLAKMRRLDQDVIFNKAIEEQTQALTVLDVCVVARRLNALGLSFGNVSPAPTDPRYCGLTVALVSHHRLPSPRMLRSHRA